MLKNDNKLSKLENIIGEYKSVIVALSGGIDSTLLTYIAQRILGQNVLAITIKSDFFTKNELQNVQSLVQKYNFNHRILDINVLESSAVVENNLLRCAFCKEFIFKEIIKIAENCRTKTVVDGSNIDDLSDYRPGMEAAKKLGVKSPFIEAGFTKSDIRNLAKAYGLPNWNTPPLACLATRIPFGTPITKEILEKVEEAENYIRSLGYSGFRVRHHDNIARIMLNSDDIENFVSKHRGEVDSVLKGLGYEFVCVDLTPKKSG